VKFYDSSGGTFQCIGHPSIVLKFSQVNDNSCDCPDGSDEPGTSHCAHLSTVSPIQPVPGSVTGNSNTTPALPGFWCPNEGHIGAYVPFRAVNDGVCDYELCCDGGDEYAHVGGLKCENRCAAIGKEYRRVEEEKRKTKEKAVKKRRTLVKEARQMRKNVEAKIATLNQEIQEAEAKRDELQKKLEEVERSEKGKVVRPEGTGGKLGVLLGLAKKRVQELRDTLDKVLDQRDDLKDRVDELEEILRKFKEEYNPNFNDEGVKAAVKGWEDYAAKQSDSKKTALEDSEVLEVLKEDSETTGVNWKEFEEEGSDTDIRKSSAYYS
jgi:protein kinase C substrate 80K-H